MCDTFGEGCSPLVPKETEVVFVAWKFEAGIPLTLQISDRIRKGIICGEYPPGVDFPTVRQIATEASVNPNTVQKALVILEEEGLIVTMGTAGRTVTADTEIISRARERVSISFITGVIREARLLGISEDELYNMIRRKWENE